MWYEDGQPMIPSSGVFRKRDLPDSSGETPVLHHEAESTASLRLLLRRAGSRIVTGSLRK